MMTSTYAKTFGAVLLAGSFLLVGCDDSTTNPPAEPVPDAVEVAPETITLSAIGATEQLSVTVWDEDGDEIPDPTVSFDSSDDEVATVDEDGLVEAVGEGTATITATSGEVSASVEVTVQLDD